jgi:hypothetical protein
MRCLIAVLLLMSASLAHAEERAIAGVKTVVTFADGKATIQVINNSQHSITGYAIGITATLKNGALRYSERIKDYGPPALNLETPLRPGNTAEETVSFPPSVVSVSAVVVVAIYDNQTADVLREDTFKHLVLSRQQISAAMEVSAEIFRNASLDPAPRSRARTDFSKAIAAVKNGELLADKGFLESDADEAGRASSDDEASFMGEEAKLRERQAAAYRPYAVVRRLP